MISKLYSRCVQLMALVLISAAFMGCEGAEDEQAVMSVVSDGVALMEEGKLSKLVHLTTKDFLAQPGKLNRKAATTKLLGIFRANDGVTIMHPAPEIEVLDGGAAASVTMPFVIAKKGASVAELDALYDDRAEWERTAGRYTDVRHVEISLVKENDQWMVRTVRF